MSTCCRDREGGWRAALQGRGGVVLGQGARLCDAHGRGRGRGAPAPSGVQAQGPPPRQPAHRCRRARLIKLQLAPDHASAAAACVIQPRLPDGRPALRAPTALAFRDGLLWALNARLLDCPFVLPCTRQHYEIVAVRPGDVC